MTPVTGSSNSLSTKTTFSFSKSKPKITQSTETLDIVLWKASIDQLVMKNELVSVLYILCKYIKCFLSLLKKNQKIEDIFLSEISDEGKCWIVCLNFNIL